MSAPNLVSVTQSTSDPTIQNYSITYTPHQFNPGTFPTSSQVLSYSFSDLYNAKVNGLNQTISQILNNPAYHDVKINSINTKMTGSHGFNCSDGTNVILNLYDDKGNQVDFYNYSDRPPGTYSGTSTISINETLLNPPILDRYTALFFVTYVTGCGFSDFVNMLLTFTVDLQVGICNAQSINNPQCVNYCITNPINCKNDYINYCFSGEPKDMPIGSDAVCRNFVQNNGPTVEFDNGLKTYCAAKYKGFGDLFGSSNEVDKDLCACHMPEEQYQSFAQEIFKIFEGFGSIGLIDQCLVPRCASGGFKSTITTKTCPLPACLNIVTFNNDGTFDNSNVQINQNVDCANIKPVGGGNVPIPVNNTWIWIILAIIAAIIIFVIIITLLVKYKRHKRAEVILTSIPILPGK